MDQLDRELMRSAAAYLKHAAAWAEREQASDPSPLGLRLSAHLGADALTLPVVTEVVAEERLVDADLALAELQQAGDGELVGVSGNGYRRHADTPELLRGEHGRFDVGPVDYEERPTGPDSSRRVVRLGVRLLRFQERPLVVVQRGADERFGREHASLDVIAEDPDLVSSFLARLRERMVALSVLRGQLISFTHSQFGAAASAGFLRRPQVPADDIVLPDGILAEVSARVLGIGRHRELLTGLGQHLKRGVLLYGPPGTGKTLVARHLVGMAEGATVVLLRGAALSLIDRAADIARTFQPSIVVLEDVDLVAMERDYSPQPLLFELLDALDGLDGDADVAFLMTTNRVDVLERALVERPGRVDLAVELPPPGRAERRRLLELYSRGIGFSAEALDDAAARTDHTTASFAKELVRSSVLLAADRGEPLADAHLAEALERLLSSAHALTRRMLGEQVEDPDDQVDEVGEAR